MCRPELRTYTYDPLALFPLAFPPLVEGGAADIPAFALMVALCGSDLMKPPGGEVEQLQRPEPDVHRRRLDLRQPGGGLAGLAYSCSRDYP